MEIPYELDHSLNIIAPCKTIINQIEKFEQNVMIFGMEINEYDWHWNQLERLF